jgi:hypothetical protein
MADREQLYTALRNADKAGDTAAAKRLAQYIQSLPPESAPDNGGIPVSAEERAYGARQRAIQAGQPVDASGMVEPGNIDLTKRPRVQNADGSVSTVRSMGVNIDGKEVLVPTVSDDGRIMSDQEAIDTYRRTGRHLGKFSSPAAADAYAQNLHLAQEKLYAAPPAAPAAPADPSLVDKIIGGGETALSLATGATTGTLGMLGGTAKGLAQSVLDGTFGTQQGVRNVEQAAAQGADALTYSPRTATGQQYTQAAGDAVNEALPVMPLTEEMGMLGRGAQAAKAGVRDLAANTNAGVNAADAALAAAPRAKLRDAVRAPKYVTAEDAAKADAIARIRTTNPQLADLVHKVNPPAVVSDAELSGVGAAKTQEQALRAQRFAEMGIEPTQGQLDRTFEQQKFEREAAKTPEGKAINDRFAEQNAQVDKYMEGLADQTGAEPSDLYDLGKESADAMEAKQLVKKAEVRDAYNTAEAAGEMAEPVDVTNLMNFVNANKSKSKVAPIISVIGSELEKNAKEVGGGLDPLTLIPTKKRLVMPLNATESLRQAIGDLAEPGTPNVVFGKQAKRVLDIATEDKGGPLYRQARRMYENYAREFVNRDVIDKFLRTKPGTSDRAVPFEEGFKHLILNQSQDAVRHVFRVLEAHPKNAPVEVVEAGQRAAAGLRRAFVNHIKEDLFSNAGADIRGNVVGSQAKIRRLVDKLDRTGKLEAVLGKQGAQKIRDIRDAAVDLYTSPEGTVNRSNNANTIAARLDKVAGMLGGTPVAGHAIKYAAKKAASRELSQKVNAALHPKKHGKF